MCVPRAMLVLAAWLCTAACAGQVRVRELEVQTPAGLARGWVAQVDLSSPAVELVVGVQPAQGEPGGLVRLETVEDWASAAGVSLAVNANYFGSRGDGLAQVVGLCVSEGETVSPARSHGGVGDPVLVVDGQGVASITTEPSEGARLGVAGVGGSANSDVPGTLLVDDGVNLGASARVEPMARHPRTAAGVSRDGRTLWLVVIDGRQPGWSVGVTLPELGEVLLAEGAHDAVNLDGGGSSALVWREGGLLRTNRPSDGSMRPVAVSLGVRVTRESDLGVPGGVGPAGR